MGKLFLVRHGRTEWNKGEVFRGTAEVPLDDLGREQARLVGQALREQVPDSVPVLCSPLSRAAETARIVAGALGVTAVSDPRFTDIDVGEWSGMSLKDVSARYPGVYDAWVRAPDKVRFPGGETLEEVQRKAWDGVLSLVPRLTLGDAVVVSHRLTLKTIILRAVGAELRDFWKIRLDTGSVSILETGGYGAEEGAFTLSRLNDVSHLAPLRIPDRIDF